MPGWPGAGGSVTFYLLFSVRLGGENAWRRMNGPRRGRQRPVCGSSVRGSRASACPAVRVGPGKGPGGSLDNGDRARKGAGLRTEGVRPSPFHLTRPDKPMKKVKAGDG